MAYAVLMEESGIHYHNYQNASPPAALYYVLHSMNQKGIGLIRLKGITWRAYLLYIWDIPSGKHWRGGAMKTSCRAIIIRLLDNEDERDRNRFISWCTSKKLFSSSVLESSYSRMKWSKWVLVLVPCLDPQTKIFNLKVRNVLECYLVRVLPLLAIRESCGIWAGWNAFNVPVEKIPGTFVLFSGTKELRLECLVSLTGIWYECKVLLNVAEPGLKIQSFIQYQIFPVRDYLKLAEPRCNCALGLRYHTFAVWKCAGLK